jgi:hypothetical protein
MMVFPEAVMEAEVGELQMLSTVPAVQECKRGEVLGGVPVGDGRTAETWRLGSKAARGAAQQAAAVAAVAVVEAHALGGWRCCH